LSEFRFRIQIEDPLDPKEQDSEEYILFKRKVYHKALDVMLANCKLMSKIGSLIRCGDGKDRIVYFSTHVYSTDLEEAYMLTLLRGPSSSNGVCPVCFVPHDEQHNLGHQWPLRSSHRARMVYGEARSHLGRRGGIGASKELLKNNGMYLVEVSKNNSLVGKFTKCQFKSALWDIENSDPHEAQPYDLLHSDDLGKIKRLMRSLRSRAVEAETIETLQHK
jgi:Plavaka transposase